MPAIIKGYIDKVYQTGFAYAKGKGILTDKKVLIFNTHGQPKVVYEKGFYDAINHTSNTGIFGFCGMEVIGHHYFDSVPYTTDEVRKGYLKSIEEIAKKI